MKVARHRTALKRSVMSRPIRLALDHGLISPDNSVFDYGCGHGHDLRLLRGVGVSCSGWDPVHRPEGELIPAEVVNLGYVVNVIEDAGERAATLTSAWALTRKLLIVSARLAAEARDGRFAPFGDGCLTRLSTFQKFYQQHELREWINETLKVSSVPVAPGIFYVFRDQNLHQSFVASHYRRSSITPRPRRSDILFEEHRALFEPLMTFIAARGRLPDRSEIESADEIPRQIGSLKRAFGIIRSVTGTEQWDQIREARSQDLLIYLALARFNGRPRMSQLPRDLQLDVQDFYSSYSRACALADELLFSAGNMDLIDEACRTTSLGKLTPNALYIHTSALSTLSPVLRVYEGCARAYIGAVEGANIIKLHRRTPQVSYLGYPDFERDPHPALMASLIIPLQTFQVQYRDYTDSKNPPILHRKEAFLLPDHPLRVKFARLTKQEERNGLFDDLHSIGTRDGWAAVLSKKGLFISGHRLLRCKV
jgi:DNA phosphorothioation-associated putative methyltransferase